ncbi:MAG: excinuclease ABC subunit UvrA [Candidatus Anammoxibacter sp.]
MTVNGNFISISGARNHNLKNVNVRIPRDKLVVITGVSGSGKSSLAFDTIYAEGQRRYIESLSSYARQFLDQMQKPDVDHIEGLPPTIAIDQKQGSVNPRSTVGTVTEVYDYLRLLFAKVGTPHCYVCGLEITKQSPEQILEKIMKMACQTKVLILAPIIKGRKGEHTEVFERIKRKGFVKARVDGVIMDVDNHTKLKRYKIHDIEVVIDRLIIKKGIKQRLLSSIEMGLELGDGVVIISQNSNSKTQKKHDSWIDAVFSKDYACPGCGIGFKELSPRLFSFNSPYGTCPDCKGLGRKYFDNEDSVDMESGQICKGCSGARLNREALSVKIDGKRINEIAAINIGDLLGTIKNLTFQGTKKIISKQILKEIINRLGFLNEVGLHYITLDRPYYTLSGGEAQRVRLATQVGSGIVGVCYVLDEPTIGLHPRDNSKLIDILKRLKKNGNTVIIIEHDETLMRNADYILDLGPGAGHKGGNVIAEGTFKNLMSNERSITARYLKDGIKAERPLSKRRANMSKVIEIKGARENNLKSINVKFPLGVFCCVTGVSGSGKSTLVHDILHKVIAQTLYRSKEKPGLHKKILGINQIDKIIEIDQSPIGRTPRSNPATYTKLFSFIRSIFAMTREAKIRGYGPGRFSFNIPGGRCEGCQGHGLKKIEMNFLPNMFVICDLCKGKRYTKETLQITYKNKSIADVLEMEVDEAYGFCKNVPHVERILRTLKDVGLGYIALGQSSTTLSGGEIQRMKLATELAKRDTGKTLYILDEPTTGLHFADIQKLLNILTKLVDLGNTVVVIEHHLDIVKYADYIIDLGPEGGEKGGEVVATGTPEEIAKNPGSYTGQYLKDSLLN